MKQVIQVNRSGQIQGDSCIKGICSQEHMDSWALDGPCENPENRQVFWD